MRLNAVAGAVLHQVRQDIADQAIGFSLLQQGRDLPNRQGFRAQTLQLEPQTLEPCRVLFSAIGLALANGQGFRHQQWLPTETLAGHGDFQAFVHDPLVSSVHVHQHQPLGVFGKNVDTFQLRQGITKRRNIFLPGRQCAGISLRQRREKLAIRSLSLGRRRYR
ncbi:hypothetical protein D3C81_1656680 [compost metagenome]